MNKKPEIYIEVGGRQVGKSNRLLKAVVEWSRYGDSVVIVPNFDMARALQARIPVELLYPRKIYFYTKFANIKDNSNLVRPKYFFDEFDFNEFEVPVIEDAYYCGTLKRLYTERELKSSGDIFPRLWRAASKCGVDIINRCNFKYSSKEMLATERGEYLKRPNLCDLLKEVQTKRPNYHLSEILTKASQEVGHLWFDESVTDAQLVEGLSILLERIDNN